MPTERISQRFVDSGWMTGEVLVELRPGQAMANDL